MDESVLDTLFMELASDARRSMLHMLAKKAEKLSKIAESLEMTIQEAHRNSVRLAKCGMIDKNPDGTFALTPLGRIVVTQVSSVSFPVQHKDYFENHTTGDLPAKFVRRIGDLESSKRIAGMGPVLENWKRIGSEASEFIKVISSQYPLEIARAYSKKAIEGLSFYYILSHNIKVPKERDEMLKEISWRKAMTSGLIHRKMAKTLQVCVTISEKEAGVFFPDMNGTTDMITGLFSTDSTFREWCSDYFEYVWGNAGPFDESKIEKI